MLPTRRAVLAAAASSIAARSVEAAGGGAPARDIRAIAFDAFAVFDPRSVSSLADELFPGKGAELTNIWRTRQFEYAWLRVLSQRYADFWQVTSDALIYAAKTLRLDLPEDKRARLMQAHLELKPWPDAAHALLTMKQAGLRLVVLSNFTRQMLQANVANSGMEGMFELLLSTDAVQTFKPDRRAYQLGIRRAGAGAQRDPVRGIRRVGCGGRKVLWLRDVLDQPPEPSGRGARFAFRISSVPRWPT